MMINDQLFLQIQRCVDGELSADDSRRLLAQMDDHEDAWKTLACGFLEDQRFRRAISDPDPLPVALSQVPDPVPLKVSPKSTTPTGSGPRPFSQRSFPLLTVVLGAVVAFVAGIAVRNEFPRARQGDPIVRNESNNLAKPVLKNNNAGAAVPAMLPNPDMTLELQPPGDGSVVSPSVRIPVYESPTDYEAASSRQQMLRALTAQRVPGTQTAPQLMIVEVGDDIILFEAQDFAVPGAMP